MGVLPTRPDQVGQYVELLAERTPLVDAEVVGFSHEQRPIYLVTVGDPDRWEARESDPLVIWLTFGVHGDELSSVDAALYVLHHIVTSSDPEITALLHEAIVRIVPIVNPDGYARSSAWVRQHASATVVSDPQHAEHTLGWPRGRFNHYGFDLNRQWLPAGQPEIRALLDQYHRQPPHVVADFHEMLIDWPYYFSPGVASRDNPWLPEGTRAVQSLLSDGVASVLDARGDLYFSGEFFDEFSPAMASSYANLTGSVGLLLENRGFAGRAIEADGGEVTLESRILRHRDVALGLLATAQREATTLKRYRREFDDRTMQLAQRAGKSGYLVGTPGDPARLNKIRDLLDTHGIETRTLSRQLTVEGKRFLPDTSLFVPLNQRSYRLIENLFQPLRDFDEPIFYDSPIWTLPLAFDADTVRTELRENTFADDASIMQGETEVPTANYAYAFDWRSHYAPRALGRLLRAGAEARLITDPLITVTHRGRREFSAGMMLVPVREGQPISEPALPELLSTIGREDGVELFSVEGSTTLEGPYLGTRSSVVPRLPRLLLLRGPNLNYVETGELWHLLDREAGVSVSLRQPGDLNRLDLTGYSHIVLPDGNYTGLAEETARRLLDWVDNGGVLVAVKRAALWIDEQLRPAGEMEKSEESTHPPTLPPHADYGDKERLEQANRIMGAALAIDVDTTHPLAAGFSDRMLPVHKNSELVLRTPDSPFETIATYTDTEPLAGFVSPHLLKRIGGTPAVVAKRHGKGAFILLADSPTFRGYWHGTHRLIFNSLYLGTAFLAPGKRFAE